MTSGQIAKKFKLQPVVIETLNRRGFIRPVKTSKGNEPQYDPSEVESVLASVIIRIGKKRVW